MAQPSYYATGTTPNRTDPKLKRWTRILGVYQNRPGAQASNNPLPTDPVRRIKEKILNAINAGSTGGDGGGTGDPDVDAFVSCANLTDPTQIAAVLALATSLKGNSLWNSFDAIYPFVGGNASAHSCNLKKAGTFSITWHGGVTHNAFGVTGDGTTGYGDTGFNPAVAGGIYANNSAYMGIYSRTSNFTSLGLPFGCTDGNSFSYILADSGTKLDGFLNSNGTDTTVQTVPNFLGNISIVRTEALHYILYGPGGTTSVGSSSVGLPNTSVFVLAQNVIGFPASFFPGNLASFAIGGGFSAGQMANIHSAFTTYQTTLNRA